MEIVDPQKCSEKGKQCLEVGGIGKLFRLTAHVFCPKENRETAAAILFTSEICCEIFFPS
jgi:hypothetical protein